MNSKIVVIGNGPSLRGFDFTTLSNVDALGMNAAYRYWDRINWYPTHYCCLDVELIATHHEAIRRLVEENQVKTAFLNESFLEFFPDAGQDKRYVFLNQFSRKWCDEVGSKYGIVWQEGNAFKSSQPGKVTTGAYSVRYAIHLGYKDIGLIGIDLKYVEQIPEATLKGGIQLVMEKTPDHNPNYFFDDYQQAGDRFQVPNPEVHNFDLHPVSFEVLRDDIVLRDFNVSVVNCNTRSELHARGTFPYTAIEDFIHRQKLGALVIPTQVRERDRILNNLKLWQKPAFIPFLNFKNHERLRLIFTFTGHEDEALKAEILHEYSKSSILKKCFSEPEFHFFLLPEGEDVYVRDKNTPISKKGLKSGPNQQFFHSLFAMKGLGDHVFFMETDCLPIRPDWLGKLCELVQESEDFWILGSHYRGKLPVPKHFARHINGSAVYAVGNEEFIEFAKTWQATLDKVISTRDNTLAYDCVLENFFYYDFQINVEQQRTLNPDSDGWKLFQRVASKLRYSDYTLNYSGKIDVETANLSFLRFIREKFNNSYIIHNRKICEDIYQFALGQSPTVNVESTSPKQNDLRNDRHEVHASSEQPSKESIVVSVNPDAVDEIGHFLAYEDLLHGTFQKLGIQYISLCNRSFKADLLAQRNFIHPVLTVNSWTIGNCRGRGAEPDDSIKQTSKQELIQAVEEIIQKNPESNLILYLYCGSLYHAEIFVEILQAYSNVRGVITLFWLSFTDMSDAAFLPRWQHLLTHCANESRIDLSVTTEEMQADLLRCTGYRLPVFPHPSTTIDDVTFAQLREEITASTPQEIMPSQEVKVLFPGNLLKNKGYDYALEAIRTISDKAQHGQLKWQYPVSFTVRHAKPTNYNQEIQTFIQEIRQYANILEGGLEREAFIELIRNSQVVVLPYLPEAFSNRTSGLLIDAIHCGVPVVAFADTWLGNLIDRTNCGVAVKNLSGKAIADAIEEIIQNYPVYRQAALDASQNFFQENNWRSLAEAILKNDSKHRTSVNRQASKLLASFPADSTNISGDLFESFGRDRHARIDETQIVARWMQESNINAATASSDRKSVMIDVGAHYGSALSPFLAQGFQIFAYEPDPDNRDRLVQKFGQHDLLTLDKRAVSDHPGQVVSFFSSKESTGVSTLAPFLESHQLRCQVTTTTVAEICEEHELEHIDFLKIDTEGFDLMVLKGVPWNQIQPQVIECEFEDRKTVPLGYTFEDLAQYLFDRGYTVLVSEWHPVICYGIQHDWHRLTTYPCKLSTPDAWGNLLAFKEPPDLTEIAAITQKLVKTNPSHSSKSAQSSMSTSSPSNKLSVPTNPNGTGSNSSDSFVMNGQTSQVSPNKQQNIPAVSVPQLNPTPTPEEDSLDRSTYLLKRIVRYYRRWPLGVAVLAIACNCLGMIEEIPFRWAFTGGGTALTLLLVGHAATRSDRVIQSAQDTADQAKAIAKGTRGKARLAYRQGNRALQRVKLARQEAIEASSHVQKLEDSLAALNTTTISTARSITHANERLYNVEHLTQTALKTGEKALGLAGQSSDNLALTTDNLALTTKKLNRVSETLEKVERSQKGTQRTASNAMATASYALDQANRAAVCLDLPSKTFHQTIQTLPKLEKTLFYFGHHKCATNWVRPVLYDVCERNKWSYTVEGGTNNALLYLEAPVLIQCHVNATTDYLHLMLQGKNSRGFHLIRDPRDVLVSQYWSWRNNHSVNDTTVLSLRRKLLDLSTEEGLLELIPHIRMIQQIQNWPFGQIASILEVKYEDLIEAPSFHFRQIFDHLEIEFNSDELSKLVDKHSFAKRSGRPLGSEDINSHLRRGLPGDWKNYFTDTLKQAFQEQYGDLLIQLGYEKDSNW